MSRCPNDERLSLLLDERLAEEERAAVEHHLEDCKPCQEVLERLTRDGGSIGPRCAPSGPDNRSPARAFARPPVRTPTLPLGFDSGSRPGAGAGQTLRIGPEADDSFGLTLPTEPMIAPTFMSIPEVPGYEILATLGHGGMGVVYKARQHGLDRLVALKMIRGGSHAGPEHLARFQIEAWSVARLKHPHVVQIYDVGEAEGQPFVALELLEGGSLEARVAGTPQDLGFSATLLEILAQAIASAHRSGVIHRDLKSSNILFAADGTPKIADFGLAKRLDEEDGQTQTGQVMGSPSFMAPEQASGHARAVGPAADIYSLGAILYEMLTGRPPFKGSTPMETLLQVVNDDPVPPSRLRPGLSRDLETICLKCLAKEPGRRYADAEELARDLRLHLAGSAIRARRVGPRERLWKWTRRHPAAAALVATGLAGVVVLGVAGLRHLEALRVDRGVVEEQRQVAGSAILVVRKGNEGRRWDEARPDVERLLQLVPALRDDPRLRDLHAEAMAQIEKFRRGEAQERLAQEARDRYQEFDQLRNDALKLDIQFAGGENLQATRDAASAALAVFGKREDGDWKPEAPPETLSGRERAELDRGRHHLLMILADATARPLPGEDATIQAARALRLLDRARELHPATRAYHLLLADCLARAGDGAGADREREAARSVGKGGPFEDVLDGLERYHRRDWHGAIALFEAALQEEPGQFWATYLLAICRIQTQDYVSARVGLNSCLKDKPDFFWLYLHRGFASAEEGHQLKRSARGLPEDKLAARRRDADRLYDSAEDDYREALARPHSDDELYALLVNRGVLSIRRGHYDEAGDDLREAIRLRPDHFTAHVNLAQACKAEGKVDEAIAHFDRAIALAPGMAALHRGRAILLEGQADGPEGRSRAIAALSEAIRLEPDSDPDRAGDLVRRARILALDGRHDEALTDCDAALKVAPDDSRAHLLRVESLLKLKRFPEVIAACDGSLSRSKSATTTADLLLIRGLAHAARQDYPSAIDDYSQSAALHPLRAGPLVHRGWAYLVSEAPKLALRDFEEAVRLDPRNGDALNGRGFARVLHGRLREGIADAEQSLRFGEPTSRTAYNAARVYAKAVAVAAGDSAPSGGPVSANLADDYQDRAQQLLRQALERLPVAQRSDFWRDVIQSDPALAAIRRRPKFSQLAGQLGRQAK